MNKNSSQTRFTLLSILLVCVFVLVACGSKVNEANFNKIEIDMAKKDVYEILGPPTESSSLTLGGLSGTSATWTTKEATISIQFLNEKVMAKQFSKPTK